MKQICVGNVGCVSSEGVGPEANSDFSHPNKTTISQSSLKDPIGRIPYSKADTLPCTCLVSLSSRRTRRSSPSRRRPRSDNVWLHANGNRKFSHSVGAQVEGLQASLVRAPGQPYRENSPEDSRNILQIFRR